MSLTDTRVLVTGGTGFLGRAIVSALVGSGAEIVVASRHPAALPAGVAHEQCDLLAPGGPARLIRAVRPTHCIHAAWDVRPGQYENDPRQHDWCTASINLAAALHDADTRWLAVLGTAAERLVDTPHATHYARAKTHLRASMPAGGPALCWLHVHQPYGPGESPLRLVPSIIRAMRRGETFEMARPDDVRDFVHVRDVADAVVSCVDRSVSGTFDLGTGNGHSLLDMARALAARFDRAHAVSIATNCPRVAPTRMVADPTPLAAATGWRAAIDLQSGLDQLANVQPTEMGTAP